jgi:hypothetical protein
MSIAALIIVTVVVLKVLIGLLSMLGPRNSNAVATADMQEDDDAFQELQASAKWQKREVITGSLLTQEDSAFTGGGRSSLDD